MTNAKTAIYPRGRAWHGRGTTWHGKTNPLKTKKNNGCRAIWAKTAEKAFIYKGLRLTGSLLRQVCRLPSGTDGLRRVKRRALPLEDVSGSFPLPRFHRGKSRARISKNAAAFLLSIMPSLACANGWAEGQSNWGGGSSFEAKPEIVALPSPGSSFYSAPNDGSSFTSKNFALSSRGGSQGRKAFVMPKDSDELGKIRALIQYAESSAHGYDAVQHRAKITPAKKPTQMTFAEIFDWIEATPNQQHAIGRYQIIPDTLRKLVSQTKVDLGVTFTPGVQDGLANILIVEAGYAEFMAGQISLDRFMDNLAGVWAGLPLKTGKSAHEGIAGNSATVTRTFYKEQMARIFPRRAS